MPPRPSDLVSLAARSRVSTAQAQAVNTDKDYELAFLYAEYRGGRDQSWENYVSPVMRTAVSRLSMASTVEQSSTPCTLALPERNSVPLLMPQDKPCSRIR